MGIFDRFISKVLQSREPQNSAATEKPQVRQELAAKKRAKRQTQQALAANKSQETVPAPLSAKEQATSAGLPWVNVLGIEVDPDNPGVGAFELDWNDIFVARLVKAGYKGRNDNDIVDNWFQDVCRHVVLETYQQEQADPDKRAQTIQRRDLGGGRSEFS